MEMQRKPRRRFKVLLAVSLALNLLFVGIFAGAFWRGGGPDGHGRGGPSLQSYAAAYVRALPRDDRRALHRKVRTQHPKMGRKERQEVYQQMLVALRAKPFDPVATHALLEAQRQLSVGVQKAAQDQWMALVTKMNTQEREAYANRLEEQLKRRPRRKDKPRQ